MSDTNIVLSTTNQIIDDIDESVPELAEMKVKLVALRDVIESAEEMNECFELLQSFNENVRVIELAA